MVTCKPLEYRYEYHKLLIYQALTWSSCTHTTITTWRKICNNTDNRGRAGLGNVLGYCCAGEQNTIQLFRPIKIVWFRPLHTCHSSHVRSTPNENNGVSRGEGVGWLHNFSRFGWDNRIFRARYFTLCWTTPYWTTSCPICGNSQKSWKLAHTKSWKCCQLGFSPPPPCPPRPRYSWKTHNGQ